ncbi:hypothetical protein ACVWWG_008462 [Bradyrhizobium sp. LB7.2]
MSSPVLARLATMVRAADAGPRSASGGAGPARSLARLVAHVRRRPRAVEAGFLLYDAFYRWCRVATKETHNWPTNK